MASAPPTPLRSKLVRIAAFYFASGFPFGLLNDLVPVYFRTLGVSLADIGFLSYIALPYTLKFVWSPLLDWVGSRKQWMLGCQVAMGLLLAFFAARTPTTLTPVVWIVLLALAVLSATQDMAIDAFTIEYLDKREYGLANGLRVTSYRVAMIVAGGLLLALGGRAGWPAAYGAAAAVLLAVVIVTLSIPAHPRPAAEEADEAPAREAARGRAGAFLAPLWEPLRRLVRPSYAPALLFVLTFKLGELALVPMVRPFWVDNGYTPAEIGLVLVTIGTGATIVGALVGGALTRRWGTFRALWVLGLANALSSLGYYAAALLGATRPVMYAASTVEHFTSGLGTAAFLTFLMDLCEKRYAATQYALLSALYRLGGVYVGSRSGIFTERLGYTSYFLLTFFVALPAFLLLPFLKRMRELE